MKLFVITMPPSGSLLGQRSHKGILAGDPIDEEAARGLMRCYANDLNGVRKVYKVLCESLRRELEDDKAEPLPETTTLFPELTG